MVVAVELAPLGQLAQLAPLDRGSLGLLEKPGPRDTRVTVATQAQLAQQGLGVEIQV